MSVILWILVPITILTAILLSFLLYSASIKKKKIKTIDDLSFEIKKERMAKLDAILNRVRIISTMNPKYESLFKEITEFHTKINTKLNETLDLLGSLTISQNNMRVSTFDRNAEIIKVGISEIDSIQHKFEVKAEGITQQDEFMSSEIGFYTSNLRKAIAVYRQKRILLTKISPKLDNLSKEIKTLEKNFRDQLDKANISEANILLNKYSNKVVKFSKIVNEGPTIESYVFKIIPDLVKKMMQGYKIKKEEFSGALDHINFAKSIQDIGEKYKKAKYFYLHLNLEKSKKSIKNILKSLKILERLINFENKSRNVFLKSHKILTAETKQTLTIFDIVKNQMNTLSSKGLKPPVDLLEEYNTLLAESKILGQMLNSFKGTIKTKDISYSTKIQEMKLLAQKNKNFIGMVNEITSSIWNLNVEKLVVKNKFRKAEGALNEIIASTKKNKLVLSENELKDFDFLLHQLSKITPLIASNKVSNELAEKVDNVVSKTINYYQVVGGKIQIAEIIRNLIKELSPKRALDNELNSQLTAAEAQYFRGDYNAALNIIITHLEEGA